MRIDNKRSWVRAAGRGVSLIATAWLVSACTIELPEDLFPDIPTLPDTLPDTSFDSNGDKPTSGEAATSEAPKDDSSGEAPDDTGGEAATGDTPKDDSSGEAPADTGSEAGEAESSGGAPVDTGGPVDMTGEASSDTSGGSEDPSAGDTSSVDTGEADDTTTAPAAVCGDQVIDVGELCDDGVNDGAYGGCMQCAALGPHCGDGVVNGPEGCDAGGLPSDACTAVCTRPTCGDGIVQAGEQCDGSPATGAGSCVILGFTGGQLGCQDNCMWDLSRCVGCGNGVVDPGEVCDGSPLTEQCSGAGTVSVCNATCDGFEAKTCDPCGNGVVDPGELCDTGPIAGIDCASFGFADGVLRCARTCDRLDTSECNGGPPEGCCQPGLTGTCDDAAVVDCVCAADSDCCDFEWGGACVTLAVIACGVSCG